jgi:hypothetical protein
VVLVRTDVSEKCVASITRVTRVSQLGTTLATETHCEDTLCERGSIGMECQSEDGRRVKGNRYWLGFVKWLDYKARFQSFGEGGRLFTVNRAGVKDRGLYHQMDLGHIPKIFRELIRGSHDLLRKEPPSLLI